MQVEIDVKCMEIKFGTHGFSSFCRFMSLFEGQISLWTMDVKKWNQLKKFMHVKVDVKYMQANFGGHGFSSFGDIATFQI